MVREYIKLLTRGRGNGPFSLCQMTSRVSGSNDDGNYYGSCVVVTQLTRCSSTTLTAEIASRRPGTSRYTFGP